MWRAKAVAIMADDNSQRAIIPGYDCLLVIASNLLRFSIDYPVGGAERYIGQAVLTVAGATVSGLILLRLLPGIMQSWGCVGDLLLRLL